MTKKIEVSVTAGYIPSVCTLKPKERSGSWEISTRQQCCVPILSQQQQQCPSVRPLRQIKPMRAIAMSCPSKGSSKGRRRTCPLLCPAGVALCVIFTILVSFSWDNALFASKAKINVFLKIC